MANACSIIVDCVMMTSVRRGKRSASEPPMSAKGMSGRSGTKLIAPSQRAASSGFWYRRRTSKLNAVSCIHVPTTEIICPKKNSR